MPVPNPPPSPGALVALATEIESTRDAALASDDAEAIDTATTRIGALTAQLFERVLIDDVLGRLAARKLLIRSERTHADP